MVRKKLTAGLAELVVGGGGRIGVLLVGVVLEGVGGLVGDEREDLGGL